MTYGEPEQPMSDHLCGVSSSSAQTTLSALFDQRFLRRDIKNGAIIINKEAV